MIYVNVFFVDRSDDFNKKEETEWFYQSFWF